MMDSKMIFFAIVIVAIIGFGYLLFTNNSGAPSASSAPSISDIHSFFPTASQLPTNFKNVNYEERDFTESELKDFPSNPTKIVMRTYTDEFLSNQIQEQLNGNAITGPVVTSISLSIREYSFKAPDYSNEDICLGVVGTKSGSSSNPKTTTNCEPISFSENYVRGRYQIKKYDKSGIVIQTASIEKTVGNYFLGVETIGVNGLSKETLTNEAKNLINAMSANNN